MDLRSAQLLSVPMLYINGPSAFQGSPEYTQLHLECQELKKKKNNSTIQSCKKNKQGCADYNQE